MKNWSNNYSVLAIVFLSIHNLISCAQHTDALQLVSPDNELSVDIETIEGKIVYTLSCEGKELIDQSEISVFQNKEAVITGFKKGTNDTKWKPTWGQFSEIQNQYNELVIDVDYQETKTQLYVRLYNDGVGFRYVIDGTDASQATNFICSFNLPTADAIYSPNSENEPIGPISIESLNKLQKRPNLVMPLVVEKKDGPYLSILESDLYSAPGFKVIDLAYNADSKMIVSNNQFEFQGDQFLTPWRVILVNENLGDLVTNTVPLNLAAPLEIEDPTWIKPGKTLWDWRVYGYTAPDGFTYGSDTESYIRFIDFAADYNIDYFLIDNAWYTKASTGNFELSENLDLQKVIAYAKEKNVELLLYYDRRHGEYGDNQLYNYYESLGMKGVKYGFMGENVPFTRDAIKESAKHHLLIDFHDNPVPFTGIERTYPNAITREYCHAQQDSRRAFTPETFIKMALINAIQGPLDMNNGNFDLTGINSGKRQKGPKKANSYSSTVVSEAARTLVIYSGLVCIPDAPEAYEAKADLFEFIQKQPVGQWDESKVLHAKMGEHISTARRHGDEWFIGSVYNQKGGTLDIALDFLNEGQTYEITLYVDTKETHAVTNPEAYQIKKETVTKNTIIKATMAPGGGHCMWIKPID